MVEFVQGNILDAEAEALINPVNCVGVMGAGLALQVRKRYPGVFRAYEHSCKAGVVQMGTVLVVRSGDGMFQNRGLPRFVINLPTKYHWRDKSTLQGVVDGLLALVLEVERRKIKSIAVPALGCGLGGLPWEDVLPRMISAFGYIPDVRVLIYEPEGRKWQQENIRTTL